MNVDVYFVLIFNSIFNPTNNLGRLDILEEVIENIYHTFITEDDYEIPRIEAIEAFLNREDIIEEVNKDLYFEV
jgi:hypothetical protein